MFLDVFCIFVRFMRIHFSCDTACTPRSVRDPGRSPCPDALLRVGDDEGVDDSLIGVLMVWLGRCSISDF